MDAQLKRLAALHGVATDYADYIGAPQSISEQTVREVLAAMDVATATDEDIAAGIEAAEIGPWRRLVPPSTVLRSGSAIAVRVRVPLGEGVRATLRLERGGTRDFELEPSGRVVQEQHVDGGVVVERELDLGELPLGYHELRVTAAGRSDHCLLVVAPERIPWPPTPRRADGWMVQLYAARSRRSWGIGDLGDLATLVQWSGRELGMAAVLVNPMHAVAPVTPMQTSPYFPSSKRFANPLYVDPDAVHERSELSERDAAEFERLAAEARASGPDLIDRDVVWAAKKAALELLHAQPRADAPAYAGYCEEVGGALEDFATFCALAEVYGGEWPLWPDELHDPRSAAVAGAKAQLADRVEFYRWLQFVCDQQLGVAQQAARAAGMAIGVVHDLAVGVDPGGADAWAMPHELAVGVRVGAPPDLYAKNGQDWSQPPLRPDRLRATGYAPFRDMLRSVLRNAGGIRIDHILGLHRLWWIPPGRTAAEGTFVHYPLEEMLGVLTLEASRAHAVVIGEDLGTVPPGFREGLHATGILGSAIVYFEREHNAPVPPEQWPPMSLATINTHDLPTAVGFLDNARVPLYQRLGLLTDEQAEGELRQAVFERDQLVHDMVERGIVAPHAGIDELVAGLHALLGASPCQLVLAALADAVGDPRQPNVPGTGDDVHPNWRLPISTVVDGALVPILLDDLRNHAGVRRVVSALRGEGNAAQR